MDHCKCCNVFVIEYIFELDNERVEWCRFCWAEWWARGVTADDTELFAEEYEQTLALIRADNGPDPETKDGFDQGNIQHLATSLRRKHAARTQDARTARTATQGPDETS